MEGANAVLLQDALVSFYARYNPSKIGSVPVILERFHGKESELFESLMQKYNLSSYGPFDELINKVGHVTKEEKHKNGTEVLLSTIARLCEQVKYLSTKLLAFISNDSVTNEDFGRKFEDFIAVLVPASQHPHLADPTQLVDINQTYDETSVDWEKTRPIFEALEVSYQASRVQLQVALKDVADLEDYIRKKNNRVEYLDAQLLNYEALIEKLKDGDNIEVAGLKRTVSRKEIKELTTLAKTSQLRIQQLEDQVRELEELVCSQKDALQLAEQCRADLTANFMNQIFMCQASAAERVSQTNEMMLMEREEVLAQQVHLAMQECELASMTRNEDQRERQRLRFELITALRTVKAQDKEIRALSAQLVLCAEKEDALVNGRQPYWDDHQCV